MKEVAAAILASDREERITRYTEDEYANVKEMVWSAAERWFPQDVVEFNTALVYKVEQEHTYLYDGENIKAYLDVAAQLKGQLKTYEEFRGQTVVVDWKTKEGELDTRWKDKLVDSWQWRIYADMAGAQVFNYRGISRRCIGGVCPTRDIPLAVPSTNREEVSEYVRGLLAQRNALISIGAKVWPRNMPDACNMYGRECPFYGDCTDYTMPRWTPPMGKVMSFTQFHRFITCPERSRRLLLTPEDDETLATNIGGGVHQGLAALWAQLPNIKI